MNIDRFIYDINLVFTLTAKDIYESCSVINNGRKRKIDYKNCITLYDLVNTFNQVYIKYLEDQDRIMECIRVYGKEVYYAYHSIDEKEDFCLLSLDAVEPYSNILEGDMAYIYLIKDNGEYRVSANNGLNRFNKDYKSNEIEIDIEEIKRLLDLIIKHDLFLESYRDLRSKFVFGNGTSVLFTDINGDINDRLNIMKLTFGNAYFNSTDYVEVIFRLGEELEISYEESKVTIDDEEVIDINRKIEIINRLISEIYINCDKLNNLYLNRDNEYTLRKKD